MTRHFCTYLDHRYLTRGLALAASLRRHCPDVRLWVLCLDDQAHASLSALSLPHVVPISLADFERDDEPLRSAKSNRSLIEYYFTCTPSLPLFVLRHHPEIDIITYVDADLFFFGSPEPLFAEIGDCSIGIIPHRFQDTMRHLEKYGVFNVGWLTFRRDDNGLQCLEWWRERCLDWCFDRLEPGLFADQKYLDDWPARFSGVHVIQHHGANVASWNLRRHQITRSAAGVMVDEQPLIFFHFHHLKRRASWLFETDFHGFDARPCRIVKRDVLSPYLKALAQQARVVARLPGRSEEAAPIRETLQHSEPLRIRQVARDVADGKALLYVNGWVY
jgi:hypothetical protein